MRQMSRWLGPMALAVVLAAGAWAAPAPEPKDDGRIHFLPGGVADADGAKGFVTNADGGVTALDLETGKSLWESKAAGRPLAVAGDRLWVQARDKDKANVLRVVALGLEDGKQVAQSDAVVLPDWAEAVQGRGAGRAFTSSAYRDGGDVFIKWQANTWYWGGVAPSPERLKAATRNADGVARINLESGKVEMLETAKAPPAPPPPTKVSKELEKAAARPYGADGTMVATAGDYAVAVDVEPAGARQKVVLRRWDLTTEKPLDPVVLAEGAVYQVVTVPSAGMTLVRDATPPPAPPAPEVPWTVYALATGKQTAQFNADSSAREFTASGTRAYYVAQGAPKGPAFGGVLPRTLKAVDLKTGKRLWEQPLEGERLPPPPPP